MGRGSAFAPDEEVGAEAQIDAEGEGRGGGVAAVGAVEAELGAEPVGRCESVGVGCGEVGGVEAAEGEPLVADAEGGEEGQSVEVGILAGDADVACLKGEVAPESGCEGGVEGEACVEGPESAVLLIGDEGVDLGAQAAEDLFARGRGVGAVGHAQSDGGVADGLDAYFGGVQFASAVLDE